MKTVFLLVMIALLPDGEGLATNSNYWFDTKQQCEESAEIAYTRFGGHTHRCIKVDIPKAKGLRT